MNKYNPKRRGIGKTRKRGRRLEVKTCLQSRYGRRLEKNSSNFHFRGI